MSIARYFPSFGPIFFAFMCPFTGYSKNNGSFQVVAYNVQNLFDTDGISLYGDYKPEYYGDTELTNKLNMICKVLRQIGGATGPDILLLQEIEVDRTPEAHPSATTALIQALQKAGMPYDFYELGYDPKDSPDNWPAVHCLTLSKFPILKSRLHPIRMARPILETTIQVKGTPLTLFNNHWKSGASSLEMERHRLQNARTLRMRVDELKRVSPQADFLIGGDLNSHYNQANVYKKTMEQTGINHILGSVGRPPPQKAGKLYNLWHELPVEQRGSDAWRGNWGTLMHILIPHSLADGKGINYLNGSFKVAKFIGLNAVTGSEVPFAWSNDLGGFGASDHFPLVARFIIGNSKSKGTKSFEEVENGLRKVVYSTAIKRAAKWRPESLNPSNYGQVFHFEGIVSRSKPLTLLAQGHQIGLYSFDPKTRDALFSLTRETHVSGHGRLSRYRGQWQFIVEHTDWLKDI